jgi:hypothetical protein
LILVKQIFEWRAGSITSEYKKRPSPLGPCGNRRRRVEKGTKTFFYFESVI